MLLYSLSVQGQERQTQQWIQYYNQLKISTNWVVLSDFGFRWKDRFNSHSQYITRIGVANQITPKFRLGLGFAHLGYYSSKSINKVEYRPYQEVLYQKQIKKIKFTNRFRVEERNFIHLGENKSSSLNFRFRYFVSMNIPIVNFSSSHSTHKSSLTVGNEIFLNDGKNAANLFEQNRLLFGVNHSINDNLSIVLMYNLQYVKINQGDVQNFSDIFWLSLKQNINISE